MRTGMLLPIMATLAVSQFVVRGQQTATNELVSATNSMTLKDTSDLSLHEPRSMGLQLRAPTDTNSLNYTVAQTKLHLSGPLVRPLKAKGSSDFSRRVIHLFSPFSDETPNLPPGAEVAGPVKTRAWSTIVGWSPGSSAFPDEAHHEPAQLRLISLSVEKQPKQP